MNVRFYILTILLMSSLLASSAKEVNSVSYMDFTDGANEVEEYAYDANGNMTKDLNRGIESITYDWNNMPREITFTSGAITRYTYDAAGRKLRAEYITPLAAKANYALGPTPPIVPPLTLYDLSTVDYHGDCVLRNDSLERVLTPNGYIASDTLHYYIKDYQGNVRCVVRHDGTLVESNEYYPHGGLFAAAGAVQPYKYGSKELDRTHGLDLYDSEARWYDSLLGRTSTMDPLAEKYYSLSPYTWCAGNPVKYVDPSGCIIKIDPSITKEEKRFLVDNLDILKGGEVFYAFFSELELNANFVVRVTFGETEKVKKSSVDEESVYGQYDPNNSTITFKKDIWVPGVTIVEEFYHAYQDMISKQNNNGEVWNREFEAKTIATICAYENIISMPSYNMDDFDYFDNLYLNCHDYLKNIARLKSYYLEKGKEFSNFWKNKNQKGYSEPVNAFPSTLSNILNKCKK